MHCKDGIAAGRRAERAESDHAGDDDDRPMTSLWLRRAAYGLLGLAAIAGGVVAWLVASFDDERYKAVAVDWMQREHRRALAIDGPVSLSLLPRIEVRAERLRLSDVDRPGDAFAVIDEAALAVRVLPLLAGQLVVDRIAARGVQLDYRRNAKGASNVDDFARGGTAGVGAGPSLKFDVGSVDVRDLRLRLHDATLPMEGDIDVLSLQTGRIAPGREGSVELQLRLSLRQPAVEGTLGGGARLLWSPDSGAITLSAMQLAFAGDAAGARGVDARLRGGIAWDGAAQALQAEQLAVDFGATAGGVKLAGSQLRVERLRRDTTARALELSQLRLRLAGQRGPDPLSVTLEWPSLDVAGDTVKGSPFTASVSLQGDSAVAARIESGAPAGSFEQLRLPGVTAAFEGRHGTRPFDGTLKTQLVWRVAKKAIAAESIDLRARVGARDERPLALALRGAAHGSGQAAGWNIAGTLGGNACASEGSVAFGGRVPKLMAQARFDSLDIDALLGQGAAAASSAASAATAPADRTIDLDGLRAVDGRIRVRAGRLAWQRLRASDVRIETALDDGTLHVQRLQAQAWGGSIDASGSAQAGTQRIAARVAAQGVDLRALLAELAASERIEGRARLTAELESSGKTLQALRSNLAGSATVQVRDGAIRGIDLAQRLREARTLLTRRQDTVQRASPDEKTPFAELGASFRIADGIARSHDVVARSALLRVAGTTSIDVGRGRVDAALRAGVADGAPAELAALRGLAVPVRLAGPLDAVDWRIEWSAVAAEALQRRIEQPLKDALKGLLK